MSTARCAHGVPARNPCEQCVVRCANIPGPDDPLPGEGKLWTRSSGLAPLGDRHIGELRDVPQEPYDAGDLQFGAMLAHARGCDMWERDDGICTCGHSPIAYYTWNGPGGALHWAHQTSPEQAAKMAPLYTCLPTTAITAETPAAFVITDERLMAGIEAYHRHRHEGPAAIVLAILEAAVRA